MTGRTNRRRRKGNGPKGRKGRCEGGKGKEHTDEG